MYRVICKGKDNLYYRESGAFKTRKDAKIYIKVVKHMDAIIFNKEELHFKYKIVKRKEQR